MELSIGEIIAIVTIVAGLIVGPWISLRMTVVALRTELKAVMTETSLHAQELKKLNEAISTFKGLADVIGDFIKTTSDDRRAFEEKILELHRIKADKTT